MLSIIVAECSVFLFTDHKNLNLGKSQSNYFNAQVADTTICLMQYILLALYKRFESYETIGGIFRNSKCHHPQN